MATKEVYKMNSEEFARTIIGMPPEMQDRFYARLKEILRKEDVETIMKYVGLYDMLTNQRKYNAMQAAVCEMIFQA